ncbi:plasmid mobilization relaxosome protein MobC [Salmonella enterica subsp. enterica serovar Derby]|uniref:Plasmid mobilization relaxosome protein MobC n=7 Tax=Salmonella enterica TaxID=28901 RepID=A0A5U4SKP4_SALER|nr:MULTISPECIES: plasmid mobilization relaxosome protein MobC [Salmonella]EBE3863255.1 plasmid mobilization relaxosome protein MobC [Salmonella enterica subsp. enterica serovar Agona]EBP4034665.1 plasmid mobilization relaxosome protein MobC [Salmonella enterica subsp. salamae]EBW8714116.1 plasmid mobilization relaxosome protein MobC [Salmonella enterica subsp. enterica serovar Oranienburg]EDS5963252.1 plasmid mobilization relaxosome protein MobC [Salmonella enterica subsp. enterica serovar Bert
MDTDRKRGRIELNHEERRDISIQFRVNKVEFEYLKELVEASGLERGHYIRKEILNSEPIVKRKMPEVNQKTYMQLSAVANNINQATKKLNSNEYFDKNEVDKFNFNIKQVGRRIIEINKDLGYI